MTASPPGTWLILSVLSLVVGIGTADAEFVYMGHGTRSCGSWTIDRRTASRTELADESWILGFLSGVGYEGAGLSPLNDVDAKDVFGWMDNYCRAHPLDDIEKAGEAFVREHPH